MIEKADKTSNQKARYTMLQLEEAIKVLLDYTNPIAETEQIPLLDATNRILAQPCFAPADQPPFPRSPLDGYAVRGQDTQGAGKSSPKTLTVIGTIYAGEVFPGTVGEMEAVRITTGAPIPQGADTVIRQEDTDYGKTQVCIYQESSPFKNYCFQGEDYHKGDILLQKGTLMDGISIALGASLGMDTVEVYRKPKIAVISTGDELIQPGTPLQPGKIYDSNRHFISGRLLDFGIRPFASLHGKDEAESMAEKIRELSQEADVIVTTGGVSVGEKDIMHRVISLLSEEDKEEEKGASGQNHGQSSGQSPAKKLFWRVEIKPGAPTLAAVLGKTIIICLSGNPFAAAANFELLVRPVMGKLTGNNRWIMERCQAVLENNYPKPGNVRRFLRGFTKEGKAWVTTGNQASGTLSAMAGCNCLIEIPREQKGAARGEKVWIYLL